MISWMTDEPFIILAREKGSQPAVGDPAYNDLHQGCIMFKPKGPYCQSCGMPLAKDELGGGTESDGRKSSEYCSHCYRDGSFTEPNLSADQMVDKVRTKLKQMHIPGFLAKGLTKDIPSLKRWAKP
jgi:hypothetical protein